MKEFIKIYSLQGCPYSIMGVKLLEKNNIDHKVIDISYNNKNKTKKENRMNTFPQIFYINNKDNKCKIGGYNNLNNLLDFNKQLKKKYRNMENMLTQEHSKYNLDRNDLVRILYFFNKKIKR